MGISKALCDQTCAERAPGWAVHLPEPWEVLLALHREAKGVKVEVLRSELPGLPGHGKAHGSCGTHQSFVLRELWVKHGTIRVTWECSKVGLRVFVQ